MIFYQKKDKIRFYFEIDSYLKECSIKSQSKSIDFRCRFCDDKNSKFRAKKHFGQNFLKDEFYLNQIIESASKLHSKIESKLKYPPKVVEIGVGLGDLSAKLLNHFDLIAYEIDSELCERFADRFPKDRFRLYNVDILEIAFKSGWLCDEPYILVSNLPYYIATKIILNALKDDKCVGLVVMTQKEVAEKFCASVGESEFCALSVLTQSLSQSAQIVVNVPPSAFIPPPKVDSAVFSIEKNGAKFNADFEKMLRIAFSAPRKRAIKNLDSLVDFVGEVSENGAIEKIFKSLGLDENARAHQISTENYHQIFMKIQEKNNGRK